jgi:hypothetical protein
MRAVYAGVLATVSVGALFAPSSLDRLKWLLVPLAMPAIPAHLASFALGLGSGPESLPYYTDPPMYILTFLVWWGIIEGVRTLWRWRQTRGQVSRPAP